MLAASCRLKQVTFLSATLALLAISGRSLAAPAEPPSGVLLSSQAIALNPVNGKVYAVDESRNSVSIFDPASGSLLSVAVGARPDAVAVNTRSGRVYVADSGSGSVSVLDGITNSVSATVKAGPHPYVLAVNEAADAVYVTNTFSDSVAIIDGVTNSVVMKKLGQPTTCWLIRKAIASS